MTLASSSVMFGGWHVLAKSKPIQPFVCAVLLFLLAFAGLIASNIPYLVPPLLTVWEAAAHPKSQVFMLVGAAILYPIVIGYTVFNDWLFRGELRAGEANHR